VGNRDKETHAVKDADRRVRTQRKAETNTMPETDMYKQMQRKAQRPTQRHICKDAEKQTRRNNADKSNELL